jgi:polyferredoxin
VEVDNKRAGSNPKAKEGTITMQKYSSKQATRLRVACARLLLQVFSKFQNLITSQAFITFFGSSTFIFLKKKFKVFNKYLMSNLTQGYGILVSSVITIVGKYVICNVNSKGLGSCNP